MVLSAEKPVRTIEDITLIGSDFFERKNGYLVNHVGSVFTRDKIIITGNECHGSIICDYLDYKNRNAKSYPMPVPLAIQGDFVYIRPELNLSIDKIFEADRLLQKLVPRTQIKFARTKNPSIREALIKKGEYWRISPVAHTLEDMAKSINESNKTFDSGNVFYHSRETGTRYITCSEFSKIKDNNNAIAQLHELVELHSKNEEKKEICFFAADEEKFNICMIAEFLKNPNMANFDVLAGKFRDAVKPNLRKDNEHNDWIAEMYSTLFVNEIPEECRLGLCLEFKLNIEWLPGGVIENNFFVPDKEAQENIAKLIGAFYDSHRDIKYLNIGRIVQSHSKGRKIDDGISKTDPKQPEREVYFVEFKKKCEDDMRVNVLRKQKWGVPHYRRAYGLDENEAISRAREYSEYTMDRIDAIRKLGINLPQFKKLTTTRIASEFENTELGKIKVDEYFCDRPYVHGFASDKIAAEEYKDEQVVIELTNLLGGGAAFNSIIGRRNLKNPNEAERYYFHDGDEIIGFDENGMPNALTLVDITGSFNEYELPIKNYIHHYVPALVDIIEKTKQSGHGDVSRIKDIYFAGFVKEFERIRKNYLGDKNGFESMRFRNPSTEQGTIYDRWQKVLKRLEQTDVGELVELMKADKRLAA